MQIRDWNDLICRFFCKFSRQLSPEYDSEGSSNARGGRSKWRPAIGTSNFLTPNQSYEIIVAVSNFSTSQIGDLNESVSVSHV